MTGMTFLTFELLIFIFPRKEVADGSQNRVIQNFSQHKLDASVLIIVVHTLFTYFK